MTEVEALLKQLEAARQQIADRNKILELTRNPIYREVILDGFMKTDCVHYAHSSADPALSDEQRKDALNMAQAAGHLKRYLSVKIQQGNQAEDIIIPSIESNLEELRQEVGE